MKSLARGKVYITRFGLFRAVNFIAALTAVCYIAWAASNAQKYVNRGVICVMPVINGDEYAFGLDEAETVENIGYEGAVVTERLTHEKLTVNETVAYANVTVTSRDFFNTQPLYFIDGGAWTEDQKNENVIVLSESLAWVLFGDTQSAGQTVRIRDTYYRVIGVAGQGTVSKDECFAWLPPSEGETQSSHILYLLPNRYNRLSAYLDTKDLLTAMRRDLQDYTYTDMNAYFDSIALRGQILLFVIGLYCIFIISLYTWRIYKTAPVSTGTKLLKNRVVLAICVLVDAVVIGFMMRYMSFDLWVPAFAGEGLKGYAQVLFNTWLLAPRAYLSYNLAIVGDLNSRATIAFVIGLVGLCQCALFTRVKTQVSNNDMY